MGAVTEYEVAGSCLIRATEFPERNVRAGTVDEGVRHQLFEHGTVQLL